MRRIGSCSAGSTLAAAVVATLWTGVAGATPLPPTVFTNNIVSSLTSICPSGVNASTDGICTLGSSFAHTDGGIAGTPGFDPTASAGTHVSSAATGPGVASLATMTYYFEVGGPAVPGGQIAVDIQSSGLASLLGGSGLAIASLVVTDAGSDADIAAGVPDPDKGLVVDYHFDSIACALGACSQVGSAWTQLDQLSADHLCLTQGDMYQISITASSNVLSRGATASASVDPKIIVDPQGPTDPTASCFQPINPQDYAVSISAGASTGVPEPATLGLMGLGLLGIGLARSRTLRSRLAYRRT